ncbi:hypothetical protein [Symbioplanes lichenis]|uniref:hypothetical protein n=1 Tax=Symbioplanes lichenis TaxID=1629072 RepID=UPI002738520A|nr:hypothetical protein [Actinoplanes lichenis]
MSDLGLGKESIKSLGAGAYLVNVLPSAVLVAGIFAVVTSRLYPWSKPVGAARPGIDSIIATVRGSVLTSVVVFAAAVLFTTVVLRPFQISIVQWLEGYWHYRPPFRVAQDFAVERHHRRRSRHLIRLQDIPEEYLRLPRFDAVASQGRRRAKSQREQELASEILFQQYPEHAENIMPTLLGNVLRRAETVAGERYGLSTVQAFPRLHPFLSPRLAQENETQLNVLDTSATLTMILGVLGVVSGPFVARWDLWSAVPLAFALVAALSYRGARIAAQRQGAILAVAFDLHRFEMLTAMRRRLPRDAREEAADNEALSRVFDGQSAVSQRPWRYAHPAPSDGSEMVR